MMERWTHKHPIVEIPAEPPASPWVKFRPEGATEWVAMPRRVFESLYCRIPEKDEAK